MSAPRISIVTPVFNGERTIADTINSVLEQRYPDVEYIVVDGGSRDGTMNIVRGYGSRISKSISERDHGPYDAMSKGVRMASGDIIGILNADDLYVDPNVLTEVALAFEDPKIDVCYADLLYVEREDTNQVVRYWKSEPYRPGLFEKAWAPPHPTFFVRRKLYERLGTFDLDFPLAADFELMLRFLNRSEVNSTYIPRVFVRMRLGGISTGSFRNRVLQNLEVYRACRKNAVKVPPFPVFLLRKIFRRGSQFFRRPKQETADIIPIQGTSKPMPLRKAE